MENFHHLLHKLFRVSAVYQVVIIARNAINWEIWGKQFGDLGRRDALAGLVLSTFFCKFIDTKHKEKLPTLCYFLRIFFKIPIYNGKQAPLFSFLLKKVNSSIF